jgi:hypothetical protein
MKANIRFADVRYRPDCLDFYRTAAFAPDLIA